MVARAKKERFLSKARMKEWLEGRFFLRVHMTLILGGTFLAGLAATKLLVLGRVNVLAVRYGLAVVAAWLMFLLLIRLWLAYVRREQSVDIHGDLVHFGIDEGREAAEAIGGGGNFGGAGASGSWAEGAVAQPVKAARLSGGGGSGGGGGKSSGFGLDLDFDGFIIVLLVIALVGALLFAGVYLIWSAPTILAETAFEAALAAALVKRAKKIDRPGWIGAVWRATFWPFLAVLVLSIALGWAVQKNCPEAQRLSDAFDCASTTNR